LGRKKSAIAPREMDEQEKGKAINED